MNTTVTFFQNKPDEIQTEKGALHVSSRSSNPSAQGLFLCKKTLTRQVSIELVFEVPPSTRSWFVNSSRSCHRLPRRRSLWYVPNNLSCSALSL